MNFQPVSTLLTGIGIGFIGALFIFALILPDEWSKWLAIRKNLPFWVTPIAGIGLIVFLVLFFGAWKIIILKLATWVWILLGVSILLLAISLVIYLSNLNHKKGL